MARIEILLVRRGGRKYNIPHMTFYNYTVRDRTGALRCGSLEAADRASALAMLQRQGLTPVSLEQGKPRAVRRVTLRQIALALFALLAAGGAALWWSHKSTPPRPNITTTAVTTKRSPSTSASKPDAPTDVAAVRAPTETGNSPTPRSVGKPVVQTSPPAPTPAVPPNEELLPPRHSFASQTEGLLSMALSVKPGQRLPPMPIGGDLDEDFANSLTNTIIIYDDDDEQTVARKEDVAAAKADMLEMIQDGRSVADVLKEYQEKMNEDAALRNEARRGLIQLRKTGTPREVEQYLSEVNAYLREKDIEPIALPKSRARR